MKASLCIGFSLLVASAIAAGQEGFAINDQRLIDKGTSLPKSCPAEITLKTDGRGHRVLKGRAYYDNGFRLWCPGTVHTWVGRNRDIEGAIAFIDSNESDPLSFRVDRERGYVYVKERGRVGLPDGTIVVLPTGTPSR